MAFKFFKKLSSNLSVSSASQNDLLAISDVHQYNQLLSSLNIQERPHLTALSHSSGTSSGWLKAVPQISLGLSILSPEFDVYGWELLSFHRLRVTIHHKPLW